MSRRWKFNPLVPGYKIREATQGEFFATDAIRNPAEAIVRESVQNSLDATTGGPVRVRFYLSGAEDALRADRAADWFTGAWPHFEADDNGLKDCPKADEPCRFVVCEDFGTRGLQGDPSQWENLPGKKNNFFYFFRTEGRSAKSDTDRGRWGLGKYVFPRSSRVRSFLAATVRSDDQRRLLMGQAVLKSHRVGTRSYHGDGWSGIGDRELILPFEEPDLLDTFCRDFNLQRGDHPGLSVVVPWCDEDLESSHFIAAAARDYFYAILHGDLTVVIETSGKAVTLAADSLEQTLMTDAPDVAAELDSLLRLSRWAIRLPATDIPRIDLPIPRHSYKWPDAIFDVEVAASHRMRLQAGECLAFRVPVLVREKRPAISKQSFFDLFFVRDEAYQDGRPLFIREGILISNVRGPRVAGIRAIVVVQDRALAAMLGDSENPAHTEWQKNGSNYKDKYLYSASYIEFVSASVARIVRAIVETDDDVDPTLLADYFSIPTIGDDAPARPEGTRAVGKERRPGPPPMPVPSLQPRPRRFRVRKLAGGFSVSTGDENAAMPSRLDIRAAYNIRRGNPMTRYRPQDFRFDRAPVNIELTGAHLLTCRDNRLLVAVTARDFDITVTGFDNNRDLVIKVTAPGRDEQ